jgi:hypothetical protein
MLTVMQSAGVYQVEHFSAHHRQFFHFISADLPQATAVHIGTMLKENTKMVFQLDRKQDEAVAGVLSKLTGENYAGYVFAEQLKSTHLTELIHHITKAYLAQRQSRV